MTVSLAGCVCIFVVPGALAIIAGLAYKFNASAEKYIDGLLEWVQTDWRKRLTSAVSGLLAIFTVVEIISAYLNFGKIALTTSTPDDRCVPFFFAVKDFIAANPNSSALYAYEQGISRVRLCTDAPPTAVKAAFNKTLVDVLSDNGCSRAQIAASCKTTGTDPSLPVPTCAQLLQSPPLPNGFLYNSAVTSPTTSQSCDFSFRVIQDLPNCTYSSVYTLKNEASQIVQFVSTAMIAWPFLALILSAFIFYAVKQKQNKGEPITESDKGSYAWAMEGPIGSYLSAVQNGPCLAFSPEECPPLPRFQFAVVQLQEIVEAVGVPLVAVYGCPFCDYPKEYLFVALKAVSFSWRTYKYLQETQPPITAAAASPEPLKTEVQNSA